MNYISSLKDLKIETVPWIVIVTMDPFWKQEKEISICMSAYLSICPSSNVLIFFFREIISHFSKALLILRVKFLN